MLSAAEIESRLRPHQIPSVRRLTRIFGSYQSAVDLSDTGVGKMYVGAAVATLLQLPTIVVAPKVVLTAWQRAAAHFDERFSIVGYEKLRTGKTGFGWWEHPLPEDGSELEYYQCQSCQCKIDITNPPPCYTHPLGIHCLEIKKKAWNYGKFNWHPNIGLIIFDEVQRCGSHDSLNADMLIAVKRAGIRMLGLSATAACNPLGMRALGYNLDLHNDSCDILSTNSFLPTRSKPSFSRWLHHYGCRRDPKFHGWKWMVGEKRQLAVMGNIRDSFLGSRGVRVTTDSIPNFPKRDIRSELYDLDEAGQIDRLYQEMQQPLATLAERCCTDDADHPLTKILRIRQKIELLKVPIAVELAKDYLDKGFSIGIFVNFSQTLSELRFRLKTDCIIDGSRDGVRFRQRNIDRFNSNHERIILINNEAGGSAVSLPDTTGDHPRGGLVFPGFSAATLRQLLGRFHRENAKSDCFFRILFAANTYEEKLHRILRTKWNNLDALNDSDLDGRSENLHLSGCSIAHLTLNQSN